MSAFRLGPVPSSAGFRGR